MSDLKLLFTIIFLIICAQTGIWFVLLEINPIFKLLIMFMIAFVYALIKKSSE